MSIQSMSQFKIIIALVILLMPVSGDDQKAWAEQDVDLTKRKKSEITSGFVVYEGRYIPPPYLIIQSEDGRTSLNDLEILNIPNRGMARRGFGMRRRNWRAPRQNQSRIEQHLRHDGMLIFGTDRPPVFATARQAITIFDLLLKDDAKNTKIKLLQEAIPVGMSAEQWVKLIETFNPSEELSERIASLKQLRTESGQSEINNGHRRTIISCFTMIGFILAVWALGILLSCRPPLRRGWSGINRSRVCCRQVIWLVILIVVLNIYDLVCTLSAYNIGGLWELNPLADQLVEHTSLIAIFKIVLTIGAAFFLLMGRQHRLAQVGSWWAGVLYTVLIFRWATFNSMFI